MRECTDETGAKGCVLPVGAAAKLNIQVQQICGQLPAQRKKAIHFGARKVSNYQRIVAMGEWCLVHGLQLAEPKAAAIEAERSKVEAERLRLETEAAEAGVCLYVCACVFGVCDTLSPTPFITPT